MSLSIHGLITCVILNKNIQMMHAIILISDMLIRITCTSIHLKNEQIHKHKANSEKRLSLCRIITI